MCSRLSSGPAGSLLTGPELSGLPSRRRRHQPATAFHLPNSHTLAGLDLCIHICRVRFMLAASRGRSRHPIASAARRRLSPSLPRASDTTVKCVYRSRHMYASRLLPGIGRFEMLEAIFIECRCRKAPCDWTSLMWDGRLERRRRRQKCILFHPRTTASTTSVSDPGCRRRVVISSLERGPPVQVQGVGLLVGR